MRSEKASLTVYSFIIFFFLIIRCLSSFGFFNFLGDSSSFVFSFLIQVVFLLGGSLFVFPKLCKKNLTQTKEFFQLKPLPKNKILLCFLIGCLVFVLNIFVSSFFFNLISSLGYSQPKTVGESDYSIVSLFLNLIFTALLPGICEEMVHRGMILNSLKKFGGTYAIAVSALLFGLLHLNIEQFFYATIIGFYLGFLTLHSGSIIPAIIVHFMNNALSVILSFSSANNLLLGRAFKAFAIFIEKNTFLGAITCLTIFLSFLYLLKRLTNYLIFANIKKTEETFEKNGKEEKTLLIFNVCFMSIVTIFTFVWGII